MCLWGCAGLTLLAGLIGHRCMVTSSNANLFPRYWPFVRGIHRSPVKLVIWNAILLILRHWNVIGHRCTRWCRRSISGTMSIFVLQRYELHYVASIFLDKERVLMHGHQGWNVRHGLCHIYMRYVYKYIYIWVVYSLCFFCCLFITVTWWYVVYWVGKWQSRGSIGMFGNLMAISHIMLQFIQNHSRFVMLMIWQ